MALATFFAVTIGWLFLETKKVEGVDLMSLFFLTLISMTTISAILENKIPVIARMVFTKKVVDGHSLFGWITRIAIWGILSIYPIALFVLATNTKTSAILVGTTILGLLLGSFLYLLKYYMIRDRGLVDLELNN